MLTLRHVPRWNSYTPHAPRCTLLGRFHFALPAVDPLNCVRFVPRSSFRSDSLRRVRLGAVCNDDRELTASSMIFTRQLPVVPWEQ